MVNVILGGLQVRRDSVYIGLTNFNVRQKWHGQIGSARCFNGDDTLMVFKDFSPSQLLQSCATDTLGPEKRCKASYPQRTLSTLSKAFL